MNCTPKVVNRYVIPSDARYPHMTVRENMEFPLKLRKMPKDE